MRPVPGALGHEAEDGAADDGEVIRDLGGENIIGKLNRWVILKSIFEVSGLVFSFRDILNIFQNSMNFIYEQVCFNFISRNL